MRKTGSMAHQKKHTFICKKWFGLRWLVIWNSLFNQWTSFLNLPSVSVSNRVEKLTFKQNFWPEISRSSTRLTILSICFAIWCAWIQQKNKVRVKTVDNCFAFLSSCRAEYYQLGQHLLQFFQIVVASDFEHLFVRVPNWIQLVHGLEHLVARENSHNVWVVNNPAWSDLKIEQKTLLQLRSGVQNVWKRRYCKH